MYIESMALPPAPITTFGSDDVSAELVETASAIGLVLKTARSDLPIITSHWEGGRRLEFDEAMRAYLAGAEALAASLIGLAGAVKARQLAAQQEMARRFQVYQDELDREAQAARVAELARQEAARQAKATKTSRGGK